MRDRIKDLRRSQDAPVADVQPTKQAYHGKRQEHFPKHLSDMRNLPVASGKIIYQVSFHAHTRQSYNAEIIKLDFSRCYRAAHPLIALGMAIADVYADNYSSAINVESIRIVKP